MLILFRIIASLMLLVSVAACSEKSAVAPTGLLDEISGVWRANGDGTMVSIVHSEKKLRLLFGDNLVPASLGEVDDINKTANVNVTLANGRPGVWTIRQIWNKEKTSFYLQLTTHDGTQDQLSFVRKVSTDDLNKIANAGSRTHRGAIGDSAKSAASSESTSAALPVETPPAPTPSEAPRVSAQAPVAPVAPAAITWAPSFDCAKVATGAERLICSNKELSEADVELAAAYKVAANSSTDKDSLRESQSAWRTKERDACSDVKCMLDAYQNRLAQLVR